jgi:hypothetical protein
MRQTFKGSAYLSGEGVTFILSLLTVIVISFFDNLDFLTNIYIFIFIIFFNLFILSGPYGNYLIIGDNSLYIKNLWWFWVNDTYLYKDILSVDIYERDTYPEVGTKRFVVKTVSKKHKYSMNSLNKNDFWEIEKILNIKGVNITTPLSPV